MSPPSTKLLIAAIVITAIIFIIATAYFYVKSSEVDQETAKDTISFLHTHF